MKQRNTHLKLLCIALSVLLVFCSMTACTGPQGEVGPQGIQGVPGQNGADGKDGAPGKDGTNGKDGADGADGQTPFIGENGNWWIGTLDTGVQAAGQDGTNGKDGAPGKDGTNGTDGKDGAPGKDGAAGADGKDGINGTDGKDGTNGLTPYIGENGNWWIGDADTLVKAKGENGTNGLTPHVGDNGNWWIGNTDTGIRVAAQDGVDGKSVVFRVHNNWLQWRYASDSEWLNLYEITDPNPSETGAKVTFVLDNGGVMPEGTPMEIEVTPGTSIYLPTPTYAGYTFGGWYEADANYPVSSPYRVHDNQKLYAKWIPGTAITGTPIYTIDDLANIANNLGGTYVLMNDIDCMGLALPAIGGTAENPFRGIFDGNGYTISNLAASPNTSTGLFGYNSGTIQNLKMENCTMTVSNTTYLGVIAGTNNGTIKNCAVVDCNVTNSTSTKPYAGLICGNNTSLVDNCIATGTVCVESSDDIGNNSFASGIAGNNVNRIYNCFAYVTVTSVAYRPYASGIAFAENSSSDIKNCVVFGTIISSSNYRNSYSHVGDISASSNGKMTNCYKDENLSVSTNGSQYLSATAMTKASLNLGTFYRVSLKWDTTVWNLDNVDIEKGRYPMLKVIR